MILSVQLKQLASVLSCPLYVVGGAVRDTLLGFETSKDVDLAASLTPQEITAALANTPYKVIPVSPKLGTLKIKCGTDEYEYTTFRCDSYACDGTHSPVDINFTKDIYQDALRRDFCVNAIYYDINKEQFVDPLGGIADIDKRLLRATRNPDTVLIEDGLRLLRLVRIACACDLQIEAALYSAAQRLSHIINGIHNPRIGDELSKLVVCDTQYGVSGAHLRAINMLIDLGIAKYILPELMEGKGFAQRADYHKYDVLGHTLKVFELSPPNIRLAALFHDISKPSQKLATGRMAGHEVAGAAVLRHRLKELCFGNAVIERNARLVEAHMFDLNCETKEPKVRRFIQSNYDIIDDLIALKNADYLGGGLKTDENPSSIRLMSIFAQMKAEGVPFTIKDLLVGGKELIELGVPTQKRGQWMQELLRLAATEKRLLTYSGQYNFLANRIS